MKKTKGVPEAVAEVAARLAVAGPMRRGALTERFMKCGKPGCPCHGQPDARHGPYHSLTRTIAGKTRSRYLTAKQAALAGEQIEAGHEFRKRVAAYWEVCERWADAELEGASPAATAQKGGSRRRSRQK